MICLPAYPPPDVGNESLSESARLLSKRPVIRSRPGGRSVCREQGSVESVLSPVLGGTFPKSVFEQRTEGARVPESTLVGTIIDAEMGGFQ